MARGAAYALPERWMVRIAVIGLALTRPYASAAITREQGTAIDAVWDSVVASPDAAAYTPS